MTDHPTNIESTWLASALTTLLAAPHPAAPDASPLLPAGPPPPDEFSAAFDALFAPEAHGFVGAHALDREKLKATLLGLHSRWNAAEGACVGCDVHEVALPEDFHPTMAARMEFTPLYRYPREKEVVTAEASGRVAGGARRVECMVLEGAETLFRPELFTADSMYQ
ncbi:hypothetical protein PsYK624_147170 [Phanerochaete sordida]|uniref:Uncharacterized protein n=1 Tax=Phanerochaete sordida TaxID=48140 RepID=A0A9P3LKL9_9APHY|nr:hypothetical protein PsYK624_147170 [Phanerochaete sordida]